MSAYCIACPEGSGRLAVERGQCSRCKAKRRILTLRGEYNEAAEIAAGRLLPHRAANTIRFGRLARRGKKR